MNAPLFIRPFTQDERQQVQAGFRSSDAFVLRRCQILLASARGERAPVIARQLGCDDQTVRNVIHQFNASGLLVLQEGSSRPHRLPASTPSPVLTYRLCYPLNARNVDRNRNRELFYSKKNPHPHKHKLKGR